MAGLATIAFYLGVIAYSAASTLFFLDLLRPGGEAARQWAPSYARATLMQAPLAVLGLLAGLGAWLSGGGTGWIMAGLLLGAVVPFTLIVIMPTNRRLLEPARDLASAETRALLGRWNKLHAVRSVLAFAAFTWAAYLLAR